MTFLRLLVATAGVWLAGFTLLSAVRTVVLPRAVSTVITRVVFVTVRRLFDLLTFAARAYETRDRLLALYAPVSLVLLPLVWMALIMLGFAGLFWATGYGSFTESVAASGSSVTTLGSTGIDNVVHQLLSFAEAGIGLLILALLITFLPSLYSDFSRRETQVTLLEVRAGSPPTAVELLQRAQRIRGLSQLGEEFGQWETWFADLEQSHTAFPALTFFRSHQPERSWITAAGTVLDAASLLASTVDAPREPRADLCIRAGYIALRRIASFFGAQFDWIPRPTDPIAIARSEFDEACEALAAAGVPLKADRDQAWNDFAGWRVNYDTPLLYLAELVTAPYAPWTADRSAVTREQPKPSKWGWKRSAPA
ncbi:MAG TPA: hypothetical protein VJR05_06025 [Acidimicrobiia bacterium]|nr:hypothetical protein [Acidimicrobiia bacterium]